jgi:serine/threonine protein kinase
MKRTDLQGKVVFNKYMVGSRIGFGSFGDVYLCYDIEG